MNLRVFLRVAPTLLALVAGVPAAGAATITWTGGAGNGSWHSAANWDLARVPAAGDDVVVPDLPGTASVTFNSGSTAIQSLDCDETFVLSAGTLDIAVSAVFDGPLTLSGGTMTGAGNFEVHAAFSFTGGTMSGTGTTTVAAGVNWSFAPPTAASPTVSRTLLNDGICIQTSGVANGSMNIAAGGTYRVRGGGLHDVQSGGGFIGAGALIVDFSGELRRSVGAGTSAWGVPITNDGLIRVETGGVSLGGALTNNGALETLSGTTLTFSGGAKSLAALSTFDAQGACAFTGGTTTIDAEAGVTFGGTVSLSNGPTIVTCDRDVTIPVFEATTGTWTGAGNVTLSNGFTFTQATLAGTGTTTVAPGVNWTIEPPTAGPATLSRTLLNDGHCVQTSGVANGPLSITAGGTYRIRSGALHEVRSGGGFSGSGALIVDAGGELRRSVGTGATSWSAPITNDGLIRVETGAVSLGAALTSAGTLETLPGTTLTFTAGTKSIAAGSTFDVQGDCAFSGGTTAIDAAAGATFGGNVSISSGGTLVTCDCDVTIPAFLATQGTWNGAGDLTLTNGFTFKQATLGGSGTITVAPGVSWTIEPPSAAPASLQRGLISEGHCAQFGSGDLMISAPGFYVVAAGGEHEFQNDRDITGAGPVEIQSGGLLTKTAGTGVSSVAGALTVGGTVRVETGKIWSQSLTNFASGALTGGTYDLTGGFMISGANVVTLAATLILNGPSSALENQFQSTALTFLGSIAPAGTLVVRTQTLSTSAQLVNTGTVDLQSASLTAEGGYRQNAGATLLGYGTTLQGGPDLGLQVVEILAGTLSGGGLIRGDLTNAGILAPGYRDSVIMSPTLLVIGDYVQTPAGRLEIELLGPESQHLNDELKPDGDATLDGELHVALVDGFQPSPGDSFHIVTTTPGNVTGTFATSNLPIPGENDCLHESYFPKSVQIRQSGGLGIVADPAPQSLCAGDPASFTISVAGTPPFTIQWRKDGGDIPGANDSTYAIGAVQAGDAGAYDAVVTGVCGPVFSGAAQLTVGVCADTFYVNVAAAPGGDGLSWATAFDDLQDALSAALASGNFCDLWVAQGTYRPHVSDRTVSFELLDGVALYGGFTGSETTREARDPGVRLTVLSGDLLGDDLPGFVNDGENSLHIVRASGVDSTAVLDGFQIVGGNADGSGTDQKGGGVLCLAGAAPRIVDCVVTACRASKGGGAVYCEASAPVFEQCFLSSCRGAIGGALRTELGAAPRFEGGSINDNEALTDGGGGGVNIGSNPSFVGVTFSQNLSPQRGAGIWNDGGSATFTACIFDGNVAGGSLEGSGGAMANTSGATPALTGCTFLGNLAQLTAPIGSNPRGGAIYSEAASPTLFDCIFTGNQVVTAGPTNLAGGGAVAQVGSGTVTAMQCRFEDNHSLATGSGSVLGGAMLLSGGRADLTNVWFSGNTAASKPVDAGGAIAVRSGSGIDAVQAVFTGNRAGGQGGAIAINSSDSSTVIGATFSRDSAGTAGGGIHLAGSGLLTLVNSVLWDNRVGAVADEAAQIAVTGSTPPAVSRCDVQGLTGALGGVGNLGANPLFVDADGADDAAGTGDDDLRLAAGSPVVDAADNAAIPAGVTDDFGADPRFVDDPCAADTGAGTAPIVDMGAYEFQGTSCTTAVPGAPGAPGVWFAGIPAPNPTSAATELRLRLPQPERLRADVIDLAGRRIAALEDGVVGAGERVLRWDGRDASGRLASPGLYFVRLQVGDASATRRVMVRR